MKGIQLRCRTDLIEYRRGGKEVRYLGRILALHSYTFSAAAVSCSLALWTLIHEEESRRGLYNCYIVHILSYLDVR
jgi:hypothetical protein